MNSRLHIPTEIILELLDIVRYDNSRTFDEQSSDLSSLSLVAPEWTNHAQTMLFRDVRLRGKNAAASFLGALAARPELGEVVRSLKAKVGFEHAEQNYRTVISQRQLVALLQATPFLYQLDISLTVMRLNFSTTEALRQIPNCRPIAMQFTNLTGDECTAIYQLTELWDSSLKHLVINGGQGNYASLAPPPSQFPSLQLSEFQWLGFERPSDEVMQYFLGSSSEGSLKSLTFRSLPSSETFSGLMTVHGPSLRSLRVRDLTGVDRSALKQCSVLEEFGMERGNAGAGVLDAVQNYLNTSSLVHLDFGSIGSTLPSTSSKVLDDLFSNHLSRLPKLRAVTQRVTRLSAAKSFCRPQNAPSHVGFCMKSEGFDSELHCLVEPTAFPRLSTPRDFRAMNMERQQLIYSN